MLTIRGGGIIFPLAVFAVPFFFNFNASYFLAGLGIICTISFIDDLKPVSNKIRIFCHVLSVGLMFYQLQVFELPTMLVIAVFITAIGIINAINFMDGINGITGSYTLVSFFTLLYINETVVAFANKEMIICSSIALIVFLIFNFRKKAICFAGDVGSVGIAFVLIYLLISLILKTNNLNYLLIVLVYGMDTITTIGFRLWRRENIFEAHRSHFYQYLANQLKLSHLLIAAIYSFFQLIINFFVVFFVSSNVLVILSSSVISIIMFCVVRFSIEGKENLLDNKLN